ncbi:hypothetical protein L2E82_02621 [Cichorium intybus]|uniref:Uncharacterized protein n=1 Tax=Cichorium intybus TaxID=13427 RepID=A0ACB9H252_CICIN|nr:hypothetical protein L2E82_02621 [Cichorium intybus]
MCIFLCLLTLHDTLGPDVCMGVAFTYLHNLLRINKTKRIPIPHIVKFFEEKEAEDIDLRTKVISLEVHHTTIDMLILVVISSGLKQHKNGNYTLIRDVEDNNQLAYFDEPLPCCGCGIGWFCLLLGFVFPLLWYYATILYLRNYYQKDPRERTGLAASAIAALIFTIAVIIAIAVIVF